MLLNTFNAHGMLTSRCCLQQLAPHMLLAHRSGTTEGAVKKTHTPANNEPVGLSRADGKRPNGATLVSWTREKSLAWDVTVPDTYVASHIPSTSVSACAAAEKSAVNKTKKYATITSTHLFVPIAVETSGAWCFESAEFIKDLGRRITVITGEPLEATYLFQRISVTLQRGNEVAFRNTFLESYNFLPRAAHLCCYTHLINFQAYRLCAGGRKKNNPSRRSEDRSTPSTSGTYEALKKKLPPASDDRRQTCDPRVTYDSRLFRCNLKTVCVVLHR